MDERAQYLRYMNDIKSCTKGSKHRILTLEEEQEIGSNIQGSIKIIDNDNEFFDFRVIDEHLFRTNVDLLMKHNLLYVVRLAKVLDEHQFAPLGDLIQEGNIGLWRAALRYDPTRGFKFITMAHPWIQQAMYSFVSEQSRTVSLPKNIIDLRNKINKISQKIFAKFGYVDPLILQFGNEYSFKIETGEIVTIKECDEKIVGTDLHPTEVMAVEKAVARGTSINAPVSSDDEAATMEDNLTDTPNEFQREEEKTDAAIKIRAALETLAPRDKDIMKSLYGIDTPDGFEASVDTVAERYKLTTTAINCIQRRCLIEMKIAIDKIELRENPEFVIQKLNKIKA